MPFNKFRSKTSVARADRKISITNTALESLERRQLLSASVGSAAQMPVIHYLASQQSAPAGAKLDDAWESITRLIRPSKSVQSYLDLSEYSPFNVDFTKLQSELASVPTKQQVATSRKTPTIISLPTPDGGFARFSIYQSDVMAPELAAKFPQIKTFAGQGIDDPTATVALDYTPQGFHASVMGVSGEYYIDPFYHLSPQSGEVAYYTKNATDAGGGFTCLTKDEDSTDLADSLDEINASPSLVSGSSLLGDTLRSYRLAVGTTGEYGAFQGGTTALTVAAVTTTVVRLDQVYEKDFAIHMTLVANEDQIVYTNASTDPYTSANNPSTTNSQNQTNINNIIGTANYDIGHVYHRVTSAGNNNGLAGGIGSVGGSLKGQGYSAHVSPIGDNFTVDYVAHEMGHQFGGRHNFNSTGGGAGDSVTYADEPGSGQSIMGYAGLGTAQENILVHSLAQFQANNYITSAGANPSQIYQYTLTNTSSAGYTSAVKTATGNSEPSVSMDGSSFLVPVSTPFALTGYGSDADAGDTLTYSWEQIDGGAAVSLTTVGGITSVPSSTVTTGPVFRVFDATTNPTRTFPNLSAVLAGRTYDKGEQLPSVARTMKFAVTVRDNHAGAGGVAIGTLSITTVAGAAFGINSFNTSSTIDGGSNQTIAWTNTGTGAGSSINAATVNIKMSLDGGNTFPITLAANTANDGSEVVQMPYNVGSSQVRFKVEAVGNVFFDVNNANVTLNSVASVSTPPSSVALSAGSDSGVSSSDGITNVNSALSFLVGGTTAGNSVSVLIDGTAAGTATASGNTTLVTLPAGNILTDGTHVVTARQTAPGAGESADSPSLSLTIDTVAPTVAGSSFEWNAPKPAVVFDFSEDVTPTVSIDVLSLTNTTTSTDVDPAAVALAANAASGTVTFTFPGLASGILPDGNYTAALSSRQITDLAGNPLQADASLNFFALAGDANHDRKVDIVDLGILAGNWQATDRTFAAGDFNYDGKVDIVDLGVLAASWQKTLLA